MTAAKIRVAGAWVDATKVGKVRIGGAWVDFGPVGVGYEGLSWSPSTPASTDLNDGGTAYNMGIRFHVVAGKNCVGGRWRVPTTVASPGGSGHEISLWRVSDQARLTSKVFTPVTGGYQDVLFDTPVALTAATDYIIAVFTNHYVFTSPSPSSGWSVLSPSGNVVADQSALVVGDTTSYPSSNFNGWYYMGPLVST